MRSRLAFGTILVAAIMAVPSLAMQTVTLPQPGDNPTNVQDPNNPDQDQLSSDQSGSSGKFGDLGSFHFHVTSGSDWPGGDPYHFYRPQNSAPDAYGSAATPGSEFSNLFPH